MAIAQAALKQIERRYVASMTSIRGRRVRRLPMREFSRFDTVGFAVAPDGSPALLAESGDGNAAVCRTNGRGPTVGIVHWDASKGVTVTTFYDLLKDSLPIMSRSSRRGLRTA